MKSVLISINPKWCELIASGKKTIEVRKSKPKIETPFKCYIYETQGRTEKPFVDEDGHEIFKGRGQVIGEFVCDRIGYVRNYGDCVDYYDCQASCLSANEIIEYAKDKKGNFIYTYGWHISNLVIYDKPRELSEFYNNCNSVCIDTSIKYRCAMFNPDNIYVCNHIKPLKRPPQSWCYVEVTE